MILSVVIDTNVMMVALSPRSDLHWLYKSFLAGEFQLIVSTEIKLEYEEQIAFRYSAATVIEFILILDEAPNVIQHEPFFKWNLISQDPTDNKFADCAISSAADYLITHDRHFDVLKQISFPTVNVVSAYEFEEIRHF
ncbi:MAG TPA: putative toxin-antitoxin system toxin component, PIN family [Chitinophagales bacterium]|nr:putative toxin-antitoxin system toxin component, PIN family [Chitinophagales bacterium]